MTALTATLSSNRTPVEVLGLAAARVLGVITIGAVNLAVVLALSGVGSTAPAGPAPMSPPAPRVASVVQRPDAPAPAPALVPSPAPQPAPAPVLAAASEPSPMP